MKFSNIISNIEEFNRESGCPDYLSASGSGLMYHNHTNSKQARNCADSGFPSSHLSSLEGKEFNVIFKRLKT